MLAFHNEFLEFLDQYAHVVHLETNEYGFNTVGWDWRRSPIAIVWFYLIIIHDYYYYDEAIHSLTLSYSLIVKNHCKCIFINWYFLTIIDGFNNTTIPYMATGTLTGAIGAKTRVFQKNMQMFQNQFPALPLCWYSHCWELLCLLARRNQNDWNGGKCLPMHSKTSFKHPYALGISLHKGTAL